MNYKRWREDEVFRSRLRKRMRIIQLIRDFFTEREFLEVDTPILVKLPGMEPNLEPLKTTVSDIKGRSCDGYLITSPEYAMKELLSVGIEKVFQIIRCFRNREIWGGTHNVEFTMIEWYRAGVNYEAIISDVLALIRFLSEKINGATIISHQSKIIDLTSVEILSMRDAFSLYASRDLLVLLDERNMIEACLQSGYLLETKMDDFSWDDLFLQIFLNEVEPHLGREGITVLKDYPISQAALARLKPDDSRFAERFEIYCGGMELCNGFSELTDPIEQRRRFACERVERQKNGMSDYSVDEVFLGALGDGFPECAGVALGVDRLIMLLLDARGIEDVLLFPTADLFGEGSSIQKL